MRQESIKRREEGMRVKVCMCKREIVFVWESGRGREGWGEREREREREGGREEMMIHTYRKVCTL